jgi:hypothetical protein
VADNLNITIGADTSKLRADLKLAEAALRDLIKQERLLAQEAQRTGERGKLDAITPSVVAAEKAVRSFRKELYDTGSAMDILAQRSTRRLLTQFNSLGKTTQNIAQVVGGLAAGFAGGFLAGRRGQGRPAIERQLGQRQRRADQDPGPRPRARRQATDYSGVRGDRQGEPGERPAMLRRSLAVSPKVSQKLRTEAGKPIAPGWVTVMRGNLQSAAAAGKEVQSTLSGGVAVIRGGAAPRCLTWRNPTKC